MSAAGPARGSARGQAQADDELEDAVGVGEVGAVQLAQLGHPVAHGLRVHVQVGGDVLAAALVQQPGAQRLGEPFGSRGPQRLHGRQRAAALSKRVRVVLTVPGAEGPRIVFPVAALSKGKASEAGRAFVHFLEGDTARRIFERYGFVVLSRKPQP